MKEGYVISQSNSTLETAQKSGHIFGQRFITNNRDKMGGIPRKWHGTKKTKDR